MWGECWLVSGKACLATSAQVLGLGVWSKLSGSVEVMVSAFASFGGELGDCWRAVVIF